MLTWNNILIICQQLILLLHTTYVYIALLARIDTLYNMRFLFCFTYQYTFESCFFMMR